MYFIVKNEIYLFIPKILVIFANMAEVITFIATYFLSTSRWPCYFCLISNKDFNNITLTHIDLWTSEKMKEVTNINQARELSIHTDFNFF